MLRYRIAKLRCRLLASIFLKVHELMNLRSRKLGLIAEGTPVTCDNAGSIVVRPYFAASCIRPGCRRTFDFFAARWCSSDWDIRNWKHSSLPAMTAAPIRRYRFPAMSYSSSSHFSTPRWFATFGACSLHGHLHGSSIKDANGSGRSACWTVHSWQAEQFAFSHLATWRCPLLHALRNACGWQPLLTECSHSTWQSI